MAKRDSRFITYAYINDFYDIDINKKYVPVYEDYEILNCIEDFGSITQLISYLEEKQEDGFESLEVKASWDDLSMQITRKVGERLETDTEVKARMQKELRKLFASRKKLLRERKIYEELKLKFEGE